MAWNSQRIYLKPLSFECHSKRLHLRGVYYLTVYRYLKTFIIMANIEVRFKCDSGNKDYSRIQFNGDNVSIGIWGEDDILIRSILLDKSTAIKFAKTLRTEINKIKEVDNV